MKQRQNNKKGCVIFFCAAIGLLGALFIAGVLWDSQYTDYGRNAKYFSDRAYAHALGIPSLRYNPLTDRYHYGKPEKTERWVEEAYPDITMVKHTYPNFDALFIASQDMDGTEDLHMILIVVTNENLRFGRMKIGLGSTMDEVHQAYAEDPQMDAEDLVYCADDFPHVDEGYYGDDWCRILFRYDAQGKVESMAYASPAN